MDNFKQNKLKIIVSLGQKLRIFIFYFDKQNNLYLFYFINIFFVLKFEQLEYVYYNNLKTRRLTTIIYKYENKIKHICL